MTPKEMIEVLESNPGFAAIIKYFGDERADLSDIFVSYTTKFGGRQEIMKLLRENELEKYIKSKTKGVHSLEDFGNLLNNAAPLIVNLKSPYDDLAGAEKNWMRSIILRKLRNVLIKNNPSLKDVGDFLYLLDVWKTSDEHQQRIQELHNEFDNYIKIEDENKHRLEIKKILAGARISETLFLRVTELLDGMHD